MCRERTLYLNKLGRHESIPLVTPKACGDDKGYAFIVMPKFGLSLKEVIQAHAPLSKADVSMVADQMVRALLRVSRYCALRGATCKLTQAP